MEWLNAKTFEEFKNLGTFNAVRQQIKTDLGTKLELKVRGWKDLWEAVQNVQKLSSSTFKIINSDISDINSEINIETEDNVDDSSLYFKSESARIIYALVELDERYRLNELGVDITHYRNAEKAKKWRNKIAKLIHPDYCQHPKATLAMNILTDVFSNMVRS
ncbi:hypothetical protein H6F62_12210 [Anabaena sp. FACHB-1391]|uniref:hypothetical protein n=1 Tax=Anabaena sp. FACHB-1391 TaxID=2692771 RepID=UPI0016816F13|nr:hypothetical protein [Anabaena sp. FACHB-1391]MBD2269507.1 hypothetical protein [Anabaena sp. FACHB-1391]